MRKIILFAAVMLVFTSCGQEKKLAGAKEKIKNLLFSGAETQEGPRKNKSDFKIKKTAEKKSAPGAKISAAEKNNDAVESFSIAYINDFSGDCELKRKGKEIGEAVTDIYLPLNEGDTVITEFGSSMEVVFDDATIIKLDPESRLVIRGLKREAKDIRTVIEVIKGRIMGVVKKLTDDEEFVVRTKMAMAAVKGTELIVETGDEDKIGVYEGKVVVTSYDMDGDERGKVILEKEQETIIAKRLKGPEKPRRLSGDFVRNYKKIKDIREKIKYIRKLRRSGKAREHRLERRLKRIDNVKKMMSRRMKTRSLSRKDKKLMEEIIKREKFYKAQLDDLKREERRTKRRIKKYLKNKESGKEE